MKIQENKNNNFATLIINGKEYDVYLARTDKQKEKGLQGFSELPNDEGMLFINDDPEDVWYHMKNVFTPLDLIFMDEDMKVTYVAHGKENDPTPIKAKNVSFVLEVSANSGIKEGDEADLVDDITNAVMKVLAPDGSTQMELESGERIVSRKETKVLIRKALKADRTNKDSDYKSLGKYIFKVLKGQDGRDPEYVDSPKTKEE